MPSYAPQARTKTGNRSKDVNSPLFAEAERRVFEWLVADGHKVQDARKQKTYYDFAIDGLWTVDVKCDQYASTTGRVAWEIAVAHHNGNVIPGWGKHEGLDYVAYILPGAAEEKWRLYLVDAERVRDLLTRIDQGRLTPPEGQYVAFTKVGTDRDGIGIAIGLELLRSCGAMKKEGHV